YSLSLIIRRRLGSPLFPSRRSSDLLDSLAEDYIRSRKGEPAFKGYGTEPNNLFPASLCTSVDDEVVHGIPGARALREGEIISIDVGVKLNEFFGDGAWTYEVGKISEVKRRLL